MQSEFAKLFRRWFASVDHTLLFTIFAILAIGIWVSIASTPAVAMKLGFTPFHFVKQHVIIAPIAGIIVVFVSFLQARHIRLLSVLGYVLCIAFVVGTIFFGTEIKGARRWLNIFGFSFQPSEFLKPVITIITAWLLSEQYRDRRFPGIVLSIVSITLVVPLLLLQPDVGMTVVIVGTWFAQLFISGLSIFMIFAFAALAICAMLGLYFTLPHFADRIDRFLAPGEDADLFQVHKSLEAFKSGGFFGKGPGEGIVKNVVPDAHSDFVFSVIGEEFGFIACLLVITLFIIFIAKAISKIMQSSSIFSFSAVFGVLFQIALQVLINVCTALNLIPTKGMTLPFISYGGCSMLATAISFGIALSLTKKTSLNRENV